MWITGYRTIVPLYAEPSYLFYSVLYSKLQLNCYFITTFNKNQQVHESARKECPPLLTVLPTGGLWTVDCVPCLAAVAGAEAGAGTGARAGAGAWANGAWFCGSIKFILSVGIKIKMLVIFLAFLFSCHYPSFLLHPTQSRLEINLCPGCGVYTGALRSNQA